MGLGQGLGSTLHLKGWHAAWERHGGSLPAPGAENWGEIGRFGDLSAEGGHPLLRRGEL